MRAVIFDVDGTLIDSVDLHARAWHETLLHFGKRVSYDEVRSQIGKGGDQLLPVFFTRNELSLRGDLIEQWRGDLYKSQYMKRVRAFPKVRELFIEILRKGLKIALASSAKSDELQLYKTVAQIDDLLDAETSSEDAGRSKPYPEIFQAALNRLGMKPAEAIVVGDTPWDAIAAHRAGIGCIGVLSGGFALEDLRSAGCLEVRRDPSDLLQHLDDFLA
jgi:HAD superfamily hydrolase (TIGR01509 family)